MSTVNRRGVKNWSIFANEKVYSIVWNKRRPYFYQFCPGSRALWKAPTLIKCWKRFHGLWIFSSFLSTYIQGTTFIAYFCRIFQAPYLFKVLCLLFLSNFPDPTFIPDSRVTCGRCIKQPEEIPNILYGWPVSKFIWHCILFDACFKDQVCFTKTEGPRLSRILGLEKNHVMQKFALVGL